MLRSNSASLRRPSGPLAPKHHQAVSGRHTVVLGAPKPVKAMLQAELGSLLTVGLLISTCLCLVGKTFGPQGTK